VDALATRTKIIDRAVEVASTAGLEGLTIGTLAGDLGMSKAGVLGHFGSKEALQLAALDAAVRAFTREVPGRVRGLAPGRDRLLRLCDAWIDYLDGGRITAGGCFLTAAAAEFDGRPGAVREAVVNASRRWLTALHDEVRAAVQAGDLPAHTDTDQLVFELNAIALGANQAIQLHEDPTAGPRARRAMRRALTAPARHRQG